MATRNGSNAVADLGGGPPAAERPGLAGRRRVLLGARVANLIVNEIRDTNLAAGATLPSEGEYAERFAVSQRAVRDALRLLSQQGVVETRQGKRAAVGELRSAAVSRYFEIAVGNDETALEELIEFRQALESKAAGRAASRIGDDAVEELSKLLEKARRPGLDIDEHVKLDVEFHHEIVRASGNRFFDMIVTALADLFESERRREQLLCDSFGGDHEKSYREHQALIMALASHDSALAEQSMRSHLDNVRVRVETYGRMNNQSDGPAD